MSSSDSEDDRRPAKVPPRRAAAAEDSDDSDDDRRQVVSRRVPAARVPAAKRGDDEESDSDESDSDEEDTRRAAVPPRGGRRAADNDSDDTDEDDDNEAAKQETSGLRRQAQLWLPVNYDDMTQDEFYELLKAKSRAARMEEKRMHEEMASQKQKADDPLEHFIDDQMKGYTYQTMLSRVFAEIRLKNPELGEGANKRVKLPVPKTEKSGSKKTALTNFEAMCKAMNREMDHVKDFMEKHLTTTSSIDGNNCLIMKIQNVKGNQIEAVFQKYVEEFCQCGNCGGIATDLTKDPSSRLWNLKCRSCRASRTVQAASTATYQATTTKRSRLRNKAAL